MMVRDGAKVKKGDIIAKIIKLGEGTKDISWRSTKSTRTIWS